MLEHNLNRQGVAFIRMQADLPELADFPRLTHEDLILIAVGTYHLKIARSYCSEHIKQTGVYELEVFCHPELIHINDENCLNKMSHTIEARKKQDLLHLHSL